MLYRFFQGTPPEFLQLQNSVQQWQRFAQFSFFCTLIIAIVAGLFTIGYLYRFYKIHSAGRVYGMSKAFWMLAGVFAILHTILIYWLSYLVFAGNDFSLVFSTELWRVRLLNAIASVVEFFLIFYLTAKLVSFIPFKTRTLVWPR